MDSRIVMEVYKKNGMLKNEEVYQRLNSYKGDLDTETFQKQIRGAQQTLKKQGLHNVGRGLWAV